MGDARMLDYMLQILHDPFYGIYMGITAENVTQAHAISRQQMDELAEESHRRAAAAIAAGRFKGQIVPVPITTRKGTVMFDCDKHVKADTTVELLGRMKPAFRKEDGAGAVVLATASAVKAHSLKPLARLASYALAGVDPRMMGLGPVLASTLALKKAGLSVHDLDIVESNEAFAAQACAVTKLLDLDPAKVNPNSSGISLGHPVGGTGAIITTKAIHELHRTGGRYALVTMCIGGGQGIAAVFERVRSRPAPKCRPLTALTCNGEKQGRRLRWPLSWLHRGPASRLDSRGSMIRPHPRRTTAENVQHEWPGRSRTQAVGVTRKCAASTCPCPKFKLCIA